MKAQSLAITAIASLLAMPLFAAELPEGTDADGNGTYSLEELQTVYADLTAETFAAVDANADGQADMAEIDAAIAASLLPAG